MPQPPDHVPTCASSANMVAQLAVSSAAIRSYCISSLCSLRHVFPRLPDYALRPVNRFVVVFVYPMYDYDHYPLEQLVQSPLQERA